MKNPWIFRQIAARLTGGEARLATLEERRDIILEHFRMIIEGDRVDQERGEGRRVRSYALHKVRTFTGWYTHGLPGGRKLRQKINDLETAEDFLEAMEVFFVDLEAEGFDLSTPVEAGPAEPLGQRSGKKEPAPEASL